MFSKVFPAAACLMAAMAAPSAALAVDGEGVWFDEGRMPHIVGYDDPGATIHYDVYDSSGRVIDEFEAVADENGRYDRYLMDDRFAVYVPSIYSFHTDGGIDPEDANALYLSAWDVFLSFRDGFDGDVRVWESSEYDTDGGVPADGRLVEVVDGWYAAMDYSPYGKSIIDMEVGDRIVIDGRDAEIDAVSDYPEESTFDDIYADLGDDGVFFQTSVRVYDGSDDGGVGETYSDMARVVHASWL